MSNYKAKITLEAEDKASKPIKNVDSAFDDLDKSGAKSIQRFDEVKSAWAATAGTITAVLGATAAALAIVNKSIETVVSTGVTYNSNLEQSRIGIASMVASLYVLKDANGAVATGQKEFNLAQERATSLLLQLEGAADRTAASYMQIVQGYQAALPGMQALKIPLSEQAGLVEKLTVAAGALGVKMEDLPNKLRFFFTGEGAADENKLGKFLGVRKEDIEQWQKAGTALTEIENRVKAFAIAGDVTAMSWEGLTSTLASELQKLAGVAVKPIMEPMKKDIQDFMKFLTSDEVKTATTQFASTIKYLYESSARSAGSIFKMLDAFKGDGKGQSVFEWLMEGAVRFFAYIERSSLEMSKNFQVNIGVIKLAALTLGDVFISVFSKIADGVKVLNAPLGEAMASSLGKASSLITSLKTQVETGLRDLANDYQKRKKEIDVQEALTLAHLRNPKIGTKPETDEPILNLDPESKPIQGALAGLQKLNDAIQDSIKGYWEASKAASAFLASFEEDSHLQKMAQLTERFRQESLKLDKAYDAVLDDIKKLKAEGGSDSYLIATKEALAADLTAQKKALEALLQVQINRQAIEHEAEQRLKAAKASLLSGNYSQGVSELVAIYTKAGTSSGEAFRKAWDEAAYAALKNDDKDNAFIAGIKSTLPTMTELMVDSMHRVASSLETSLVDVFSGNDLQSAIKGLASSLSQVSAQSFLVLTKKLLTGSNFTSGNLEGPPNPNDVNATDYGLNAGLAGLNLLAGLTAGGGASDHWQGFSMGASMGAMIGSIIPGLGNLLGAVIGGVVGLIGGLLKKSQGEQTVSVRDASRKIWYTLDENLAEVYSKIETSINGTLGSLTDIFNVADPETSASFSKALKASWKGFLQRMNITIHAGSDSDFAADIDKATGELLRKNLIKIGMGWRVNSSAPAIPGIDGFEQYVMDPNGTGAIKQMFEALGFTVNAINEISRQIDMRTSDEWLSWVKGLVEIVTGFNEASRLLKMNRSDLYAYLDSQKKSAPEQFADSASSIIELLDNISLYSGDEQIAKGKEVLDLINKRWEAEVTFISQVRDLISTIETAMNDALLKMRDSFKNEDWLNDDRRRYLSGNWRANLASEKDPNKIRDIATDVLQQVQDLFNSLLNQFNALKNVKTTLDSLFKSFANFGDAIKAATVKNAFEDFITGVSDFESLVSDAATKSGTERVKAEQNVASEAQRRYSQELQLIQQINSLIESIHSSIASQKFGISYDMLGNNPADQANFILDEIERQKALLQSATNPEAIAAATQRIQQLVTQYLGLFPEGDSNRNKAQQWALDLLDWTDQVAGTLLNGMTTALENAASAYAGVIEGASIELDGYLTDLQTELDGLIAIVEELRDKAVNSLNSIVDDVITSGQGLADAIDRAKLNFTDLTSVMDSPETGTTRAMERAASSANDLADASKRAAQALNGIGTGNGKVAGAGEHIVVNVSVNSADPDFIANDAANRVYWALKNNPRMLSNGTGV